MPELPEVEHVVRGLRAAGVEGAQIAAVRLLWARSAESPDLASQLVGRRIMRIRRRAKFIVMELDDGRALLTHLRMTGKYLLTDDDQVATHDRALIGLSDGRWLHFNDQRKFGRLRLATLPDAKLQSLGPEPLEATFRAAELAARLRGCGGKLKPTLLDQRRVAGLGNIYVDEALWEARLHPTRVAGSLTSAEVQRLWAAIRKVLRAGVRDGGTSLGDSMANYFSVAGRRGSHAPHLRVFRRDGEACRRCGNTIERMVLAQRSTHVCPQCQA